MLDTAHRDDLLRFAAAADDTACIASADVRLQRHWSEDCVTGLLSMLAALPGCRELSLFCPLNGLSASQTQALTPPPPVDGEF